MVLLLAAFLPLMVLSFALYFALFRAGTSLTDWLGV